MNKPTPEREWKEEYKAKVCMELILKFRDRLQVADEEDKRKISDYNLQQFWNWLQKNIRNWI